ncbi:hypothetical protein [Amycolatopsis sp. NPDC102389]|uniref:hypothetical protein n=1 Tax=Amycolatopsis sp. NPDC102389 TaxID=3363941 RepID=UPI003821F28A
MRTITVVIGVDEARDVLLTWGRAGLVRPFLWWEEEKEGRHWVRRSDQDAEPVPLLDALAAVKYDRVRLLCLQTLTGHERESGSIALSLRVKGLIERHLGHGQRLSTVGVLAPTTGTAKVPRSVLSNRWDTTAVVVDQDGVDPLHTSREIHAAEDLAAHAALAVATIGGIWPGMDDAPFDDDVAGAGHQEPRVRLVRTHARALRGDGIAAELVRAILSHRRDPEWVALRANAVPAADPDGIVERVTVEFLAGPGARIRRAPYAGRGRRLLRITPGQVLRLLGLFVLGRFPELREELGSVVTDEAHDRVERFARRLRVEAETGAVVGLDDRDLDTGKLPDLEITKGTVDLARALLADVARHARPGGFTAEWTRLRQLAFGPADAGSLPDGCAEPLSGARREVLGPASISPAPPASDKTLREWQDERPGSLLSGIGTRLLDDANAAKYAFLAALKRLRAAPPALSASFTVTRRLWWAWLVVCVLALTGSVGGLIAGFAERLGWSDAALLAGGSVGGFVVCSAFVMIYGLRLWLSDARGFIRLTTEYEDAHRAAEHEAAELIRLTTACGEYQEVATTIAMFTHSGCDGAAVPTGTPVDLAALPRPWAFGVATAEIAPPTLARLTAIVGGRVFTGGWLAGLHAETVAKSMSALKFDRGLAKADPRPDPDTEPAARRALWADLRKGVAEETLVEEIRAHVVDELPGQRLEELFPTVSPVGGEPTSAVSFFTGLRAAGKASEGAFNSRYWNAGSGYRAVTNATRVWLPEALGPEHTASSTPIGSPDLAEEPVTAHSARLDATPPIVWSDLALFACEPLAEESPVTEIVGDVG